MPRMYHVVSQWEGGGALEEMIKDSSRDSFIEVQAVKEGNYPGARISKKLQNLPLLVTVPSSHCNSRGLGRLAWRNTAAAEP